MTAGTWSTRFQHRALLHVESEPGGRRQSDWRRACRCRIHIPTSTTAEEALGHVAGSGRPPDARRAGADVSLVDLVVRLQRPAKVHEIAAAFEEEAAGNLHGILDVRRRAGGVDFLAAP